MPVIPALSKRRQKDCSRLEGSLYFKVSSRWAWVTETFSKQNKNKDVFVNVKPARWLRISKKKKTHLSHSLSRTLLSKSEFAWVLACNIEVRGYFWKLGLSFPDMFKQVNSAACWAILSNFLSYHLCREVTGRLLDIFRKYQCTNQSDYPW